MERMESAWTAKRKIATIRLSQFSGLTNSNRPDTDRTTHSTLKLNATTQAARAAPPPAPRAHGKLMKILNFV